MVCPFTLSITFTWTLKETSSLRVFSLNCQNKLFLDCGKNWRFLLYQSPNLLQPHHQTSCIEWWSGNMWLVTGNWWHMTCFVVDLLVSVLPFAQVKRFSVSCKRDFFWLVSKDTKGAESAQGGSLTNEATPSSYLN